MNKKILGFIAIVVFAVIATVNVNLASTKRGVSNLAYANTEALTADEDGWEWKPPGTGGGGGEIYSGVATIEWEWSGQTPGGGHPYTWDMFRITCHGQGWDNCPLK